MDGTSYDSEIEKQESNLTTCNKLENSIRK